jgi:hypothetical protein
MRALALALAVFSLTAAASAEDPYKLKNTTTAAKELRVHGYVRTDETCEGKEPPEVDLNVPPMGGTACVRPGTVRLHHVSSDRIQHCIGKRVSGVIVIYIPFGGFTGLDTMQYTVRTRSSQTYEAEITVEAGEAKATGASSAPSELQRAGPMPACAALVS